MIAPSLKGFGRRCLAGRSVLRPSRSPTHCRDESELSWRAANTNTGGYIDLFEACSAFTRVAARTLAPYLYVTSYTEGSSHFVTSMTAPVASGWSVRRVGLAPTGKRRLVTAHTFSGRSR